MEADTVEEQTEDMGINDKIGHHWCKNFKNKNGEVHNEKLIRHDKRWEYLHEQEKLLIKCGYYVQV